jgi:hypothetical protein
MKLLAAVLLVCLLVTGTVSAVSMSVGSVQAAKTIVPATTQTQKIPANALPGVVTAIPVTQTQIPANSMPGAVATMGGQGRIEVYSNPSGADVSLNGVHTPADKTPMQFIEPPGTYTVVVSLEGYQDYPQTFYLAAGAIMDIHADLKPKIPLTLVRADIAAVQVSGVMPPAPTLTGVTHIPVTAVTKRPVFDCNNLPAPGGPYQWQCMLLSDAAQTFTTWEYITDKPCGYSTVNNITFTKYCCFGNAKGSLQRSVLNATATLAAGPGVKLVVSNQTRLYNPDQTPVPVVRGAVVQRQKDFISSFIGIISGLFGAKTCPAGQVSCDGTCVDMNNDMQNCGQCGMTCGANFTCCNGECADRQWDSENCGTCGMTCFAPAFCCAGSCEEICDNNALNSQPWGDLL